MTYRWMDRQNDGQPKSSLAILFQSGAIMMCNNISLGLVNINASTKFGKILSICSRYLAETKL